MGSETSKDKNENVDTVEKGEDHSSFNLLNLHEQSAGLGMFTIICIVLVVVLLLYCYRRTRRQPRHAMAYRSSTNSCHCQAAGHHQADAGSVNNAALLALMAQLVAATNPAAGGRALLPPPGVYASDRIIDVTNVTPRVYARQSESPSTSSPSANNSNDIP